MSGVNRDRVKRLAERIRFGKPRPPRPRVVVLRFARYAGQEWTRPLVIAFDGALEADAWARLMVERAADPDVDVCPPPRRMELEAPGAPVELDQAPAVERLSAPREPAAEPRTDPLPRRQRQEHARRATAALLRDY
jgi:hypothetical protein